MIRRNALVFSSLLLASSLGAFACRQESSPATPAAPMVSPEPMASPVAATSASATPASDQQPVKAKIEPRSGSSVTGTVTLTPQGDGVAVAVELRGAKAGKHGIHFHQVADCTALDATTAGGHWNPDAHPHGLPPSPGRHMGDLGNIEVGADGTGRLNTVIAGATLASGDPHTLMGRSLIVHANEDNGSQPVGASGGREACAEIKSSSVPGT